MASARHCAMNASSMASASMAMSAQFSRMKSSGKVSLDNLKKALVESAMSTRVAKFEDEGVIELIFKVIDVKRHHAFSLDDFTEFVRVAAALESPLCIDSGETR